MSVLQLAELGSKIHDACFNTIECLESQEEPIDRAAAGVLGNAFTCDSTPAASCQNGSCETLSDTHLLEEE